MYRQDDFREFLKSMGISPAALLAAMITDPKLFQESLREVGEQLLQEAKDMTPILPLPWEGYEPLPVWFGVDGGEVKQECDRLEAIWNLPSTEED